MSKTRTKSLGTGIDDIARARGTEARVLLKRAGLADEKALSSTGRMQLIVAVEWQALEWHYLQGYLSYEWRALYRALHAAPLLRHGQTWNSHIKHYHLYRRMLNPHRNGNTQG